MSSIAYPPLTTPFAVPTSCFDQPKTAITNKPNAGDLELEIALGQECLPPNPQRQSWYSPGLCMQDWTTVVSATQSNGRVVAACCPPNYRPTSRSGQVCASAFSTTRTVRCLSEYNASPLSSGTCQTTVVSSGVAVQLPIFVAYEQKDLSLFPAGYTPGQVVLAASTIVSSTASRTGQPSGSIASTFATTSSTSTSTPNASDDTSSGLSTAAKIGIGLGVPLGVLLIAAIFLIGFVYGKRKRVSRDSYRLTSAGAETFNDTQISAKTEEGESSVVVAEMDASGIHELPSPIASTELSGWTKEPKA